MVYLTTANYQTMIKTIIPQFSNYLNTNSLYTAMVVFKVEIKGVGVGIAEDYLRD